LSLRSCRAGVIAMSAQRFCFACVVALSLVACRTAQTNPPAPGTSAGAPADTTKGEHASTPRYKIDIGYPPLSAEEAPLAATLHKVAALAKREFLQALPDPDRFPEFADRQMQLLIDFRI